MNPTDDLANSISAQASLVNELLTEAVRPHLVSAGLTLSMFDLLSAVRASGGRSTQIEVARRLGIAAASLSEAVRQAVTDGLLEQIPDQTDRRSKLLRLSEKGSKTLVKILRTIKAVERDMIADIPQVELDAAQAVLKKVIRNLARLSED